MRTLALFVVGCAVGAGLAAAFIRRRVEVRTETITVEKPVSFAERANREWARRKAIDPTYRSPMDDADDLLAELDPFTRWQQDQEFDEIVKQGEAERAYWDTRAAELLKKGA